MQWRALCHSAKQGRKKRMVGAERSSRAQGKRKSMFVVWACLLALASCTKHPEPGTVADDAQRAKFDKFVAADEDYFAGMDGGIKLTAEEVQGRNTWLVWTGGDDVLWNRLPNATFGAFDLLKTISSYQGSPYGRDNRWKYFGVINEPCFTKATGPDPERFGLWLDKRGADCPPDPFANEQKYPGIVVDARGTKELPAGSYYGYPTGVVGLRLFPNPDFDAAAAKKWDPVKYYTDPKYYEDKNLIRPYRVGMACGFCHVGPSPVNPPADPENPKWENLSSTVGSQYFWVDRIFIWNIKHDNFVYQWLHTARPGTLDTSLISSDNINNPRTMNAIYNLGERLQLAKRWGKETLVGGERNNKQFNDYVKDGPLTEFFNKADNTVLTPRVLKDGSDSVGVLGALNRVFINIGLFSEEWLLHFNPVVGGKPITPIEIAVAEKNSGYWRATEAQTPNMALFLVKASAPDKLAKAPGGDAYLKADKAQLHQGKLVFAERCARCHSSKAPAPAPEVDPTGGCSGSGYLKCWNAYWDWTKTDEFKKKMRDIVLADDFLDGNYLSTEMRVPVTLLKTNACSPLATNALRDNIWDNFSSSTYKELPSVGKITYYHPITGEPMEYMMPAGGRGYTRPASLVSLWSTAPYLLNNSVGHLNPDHADGYADKWEPNPNPTVELRMKAFQDGIEQMLWPEKRDKDEVLGDKIPGRIDRTSQRTYLRVSTGYLPDSLQPLVGFGSRFLPWLFGQDGIEIGPIPKGTPVNLIMNLNLLPDEGPTGLAQRVELIKKIKADLKALPENASDEEAKKVFAGVVNPLLELSKCPDFIVNRGHYFGTDLMKEEPGLSDADKRALIEFLKTF
jgi:hypothetical protein